MECKQHLGTVVVTLLAAALGIIGVFPGPFLRLVSLQAEKPPPLRSAEVSVPIRAAKPPPPDSAQVGPEFLAEEQMSETAWTEFDEEDVEAADSPQGDLPRVPPPLSALAWANTAAPPPPPWLSDLPPLPPDVPVPPPPPLPFEEPDSE